MKACDSSVVTLSIGTPLAPPAWALLERELIRANNRACQEFFEHYFDDRGYLLCVPRWGGDDGPDDAIENLVNWPVLHALGGSDAVLEMYELGWEGHLRQYTEARTVEVPFARDGMYYKEFPVMFDWLHNGESMSVFNLQGLSDPYDLDYRKRARRYAGFYMNEDPQAPNYDPARSLIRSAFSGSRGPLLRKATGLDWAGDPIEVEGRFHLLHGERTYQEIVDHFKDYNDVIGDNPLNLGATCLALNAYMLEGESKYRDWLLEYVGAWVERTRANGDIMPSNIGLDGIIGGACDGKWYGGVYGWGFTVTVPQSGELAHRNLVSRHAVYGLGNALLLTGDQQYVDLWRRLLNAVNANAIQKDGVTMYPHMHGDQGWYDYRPDSYSDGALEVYYWSMNPQDLDRISADEWIAFLLGRNAGYPEEALRRDFSTIQQKVEEGIHLDPLTPDTRLSDHGNPYNPATVGTLVQLMLGGLPTGNAGHPLHCRVRYFDPARRRPGMPEDVGALVERMTADDVTLTLVNINQVEPRIIVLQGGAYGEHQFVSAETGGQVTPIMQPSFRVRLAAGAGARIVLKTRRYANQPTLEFPWS
jgi:hypothetical protein